MEILDPDLWNDDGTPKRPSKEYMERLDQAQQADGGVFHTVVTDTVHVELPVSESYLNYARIKRESKAQRPPEVGDIVHWYDERGACRAAIVMETESFTHNVELRAHIPHEPYADAYADHDENKSDNTWHWPCGEGQ